MRRLIEGIQRFQKDVYPARRELFQQLAAGQQPQVLLITCSDSRIDPHLLTQAEPGDLFVLRNAGNIVPAHGVPCSEAATIEFAVTALRVSHIVVCGHSHCGAMSALIDPERVRRLPYLSVWLEHARAARDALRGGSAENRMQQVDAVVRANVLLQLQHLQTHPSVVAGLERGTLTLHGWVYYFETGEVLAHDATRGAFVPLQDRYFDVPELA